jgi:hypothetical protein
MSSRPGKEPDEVGAAQTLANAPAPRYWPQ